MSSGSSSSEDKNKKTVTTVRYPPYLETAHKNFLTDIKKNSTIVMADSPYSEFEALSVDDTFLLSGYTISSFPALYDMFGKFMAGLDLEILFDDVLDSLTNSDIIDSLVSSKSDMLDDQVEDDILANFSIGMRDIDAIETSSFVIGKAIIEQTKIEKISKFDSEIRYNMFPSVLKTYTNRLNWNKNVISHYMQIIKSFYDIRLDVENFNYEKLFKDRLWPYDVMEYERSAIGVLTGAGSSSTKTKQDDGENNILGSALSGASAGAMTGDPWITAAGGIIGAASSFF
jgi:hypothetical protein